MRKIAIIFISIIILIIIVFFNYSKIINNTPKIILENIPDFVIDIHKRIQPYSDIYNFFSENSGSLDGLLYNFNFLPKTQFGNLKFQKKKINLKGDENRFFIDQYANKIILATFSGKVAYFDNKNLNSKKIIDPIYIKTNLIDLGVTGQFNKILDLLVHKEKILLSYTSNLSDNQNCNFIILIESEINLKKLNFKKLYQTKKCYPSNTIQGGRIQPLDFQNKSGYLLSIAANKRDILNFNAQTDIDHFGKIIFVEQSNNESFIFSKGHRNPQGLLVTEYKDDQGNNIILSTEHGPQGGDEINKIKYGKNYGWPLASYGKSYFTKDIFFEKSHEEKGFEEPIYSFIPSIGISELIEIPNNFWKNKNLKNIFFVSSLNGNSIYQVKLNNEFERIILVEKLFIGQRIRDLLINRDNNSVILSLERPNQIGILSTE